MKMLKCLQCFKKNRLWRITAVANAKIERNTVCSCCANKKKALGLKFVPRHSLISRPLRDADTYASVPANDRSSRKRKQEVASSRLEDALFRCVRDKFNAIVTFSSTLVRHHATRLLEDANHLLRNNGKIVLNFSKDPLERFKGRF